MLKRSSKKAGLPADANHTISSEIRAEAAVWIARLHGPNRTAELERECSQWLQQSPAHRIAFEAATATWDAIDGVTVAAAFRLPPRQPIANRWLPPPMWAGVAALCVLLGMTWAIWIRGYSYATQVGEQRTLTLHDGSRMSLNTNTELTVVRRSDLRLIKLARGEAYFEVAKDPVHPFIVDAGSTQVKAVGTAFSVRREGDQVSITLIEGKIAVTERGDCASTEECVTQKFMVAGQTLQANRNAKPANNPPAVQQVNAWRRGEVILEDMPLGKAIAEMNRYSVTQILVQDEAINAMPVSGIFNVGDTREFARAAAAVHHLELDVMPEGLLLSRPH